MRDLKAQRSKGEIIIERHKRADLSTLELYQLFQVAREEPEFDIYHVSCTAFYAGVAAGYRLGLKDAGKHDKKKKAH